jgi:hypothetical protein
MSEYKFLARKLLKKFALRELCNILKVELKSGKYAGAKSG